MNLNTQDKQFTFSQLWWQANRKWLPLILAIALGVPLSLLGITILIGGTENWQEYIAFQFLITPFELFLVPFMTVNCIFLLQYFVNRKKTVEWENMALKITGTFIGALTASLIIDGIYVLNGVVDDDYLVFGEVQLSPALSNHIGTTTLAVVIGIPIFIWQARRANLLSQIKEKELIMSQLESMQAKAQLSALQARINPHFLYNSLNSILSLIRNKPEEAEKMVMNLSELFRYTLDMGQENLGTVEEELKLIETYLAMEQTRFGEHLKVELEVQKETKSIKIPRFIIQPLVENAIKHGTSKIKSGTIRLQIEVMSQKLHIRLYDNGPDFPDQIPEGYGISSTFEKLDLLFANRYEIDFHNGDNKHLEITIDLEEDEV